MGRSVVQEIIVHKSLQMALIQNDQVVEHILAAVANPELCNTVLLIYQRL
jgi:phosphoribosylformylglycinamidine (FGAM) synthase PurS component